MTEVETPRQLLKREVQEYIKKKSLIQQVVDSAKPTKSGFVIPNELMEQLKKFVA